MADSQLTNTITVTPTNASYLIKISTDSDIATGMAGVTVTVFDGVWGGQWNGSSYDQNKQPMDINDIINNTGGVSAFFSAASPYVDLEPIKNIYLHVQYKPRNF